MTFPDCVCRFCGAQWQTRLDRLPKMCPSCKRYDWCADSPKAVRKNVAFADKQRIREMHGNGVSLDDIAVAFNVEPDAVVRVLSVGVQTLKLSVRKNVGYADKQRIIDMHKAGGTVDDIAEAFNVEPDSVVRVINTAVQTVKIKRRPWEDAPPAILKAIRTQWSQGWTLEQLHKAYKVLPSVIEEMVEGIAQEKKSFRRKVL